MKVIAQCYKLKNLTHEKDGIYIVLEGLDGSGKTTLFNNLSILFSEKNISFDTLCSTKVQSPNSFFEKLYRSNKKFKRVNLFRTLIFAYRSKKSSQITNWNSDLIIGDRSVIVSYVKHWKKYFNSPLLTVALINIIEPFIKAPDFVLLLDAPEKILLSRIAQKETVEIDETPKQLKKMKIAYAEIRNHYKISRLRNTKWIDIDSNKSPEVLTNEVCQVIKKILSQR